MFSAYDPGDGMEAMLACQCITLQFLLTAAMRDANNTSQEPAAQTKARAGAISASRTLHQWVTKFENARKRNELRAAEAAKIQAAAQPDPPSPPPAKCVPQPDPSSADRPTVPAPMPNGQVTAATRPLDPLLAAAAAVRSAASGLGFADTAPPNAPPLSLPAETSNAA
jgi:lysozyme family protein